MTSLHFTQKHIRGFALGGTSRFPAIRKYLPAPISFKLDEDDGLFIGYGIENDYLPHCMQDEYDLSTMTDLVFDSAVLENEHLRAEFVLELGGRLWSLYDKDVKRELFTNTPEFRPHNLAIRNAWFAGGAEWNCGVLGHDINTCSPRFAAELEDPELGPVLRIYDYSPDRRTPFQIDFYLPEDSRFLFSRARIVNTNDFTVPMYWWTNMAVSMTHGCRVVVPAQDTYANQYDGAASAITRIPLPFGTGFDCTYPENFPTARDHFYHIPADSRKYECLFNRDGSGIAHMSTRRLQGRKLFVWGMTQGGHHWQRQLLGDKECEYLEIQGGLGRTQQECLPMPPRTAWEWAEAFGSIQANPEKIFGDWDTAVKSVTCLLDRILPESKLDDFLKKTKPTALRKGEKRYSGSGSAALEEMRSGKKLAEQLDFGVPGRDEAEWVQLLREGRMDDTPPYSYTVDPDWAGLLLKAVPSWKTDLHLAVYYVRKQDADRASARSESALKRMRNAWTLHVRAMVLSELCGRKKEAADLLAEAALRPEADAYLVKDALKCLTQWEEYAKAAAVFEGLPEIHRKRPMARFQYAAALAGLERYEEAEALLLADGGLDIPDVREGEKSITGLYKKIREALLRKNGGNPEDALKNLPYVLDYRMN